MGAISTIVMPDGAEVEVEDDGDYPIYSTCDLQGGATDPIVRLFNYTVGQDVSRTQLTSIAFARTAQRRDTNVESAGRMATGEGMIVVSMRCEVSEAQVPLATGDPDETFGGRQPGALDINLNLMSRWLILALKISGDKDFEVHSPLWFSAGYGVLSMLAGTAGAVSAVGVNGLPQHTAARFIRVPHVIAPTEAFIAQFENPDNKTLSWINPATGAASTATQLRPRVTLEGLRKKQVGAQSGAQIDRPYIKGGSGNLLMVQ